MRLQLQAGGVRSRVRTMERAAYFAAWREKKLHGITWGVGPYVEEGAAGLIPGFSYSAPFEDLRLRK